MTGQSSDALLDSEILAATRASNIDIDALDWTHSYGRTPYENLQALVAELPNDTPDSVIVGLAFRYIAGFGPKYAPRALARTHDEKEEESA